MIIIFFIMLPFLIISHPLYSMNKKNRTPETVEITYDSNKNVMNARHILCHKNYTESTFMTKNLKTKKYTVFAGKESFNSPFIFKRPKWRITRKLKEEITKVNHLK
jgi:hypothetical protein